MNIDDILNLTNQFAKYDSLFYNAWMLGKPVLVDDDSVPTACVRFDPTGQALHYYFNESFWATLNDVERTFLFAHEVLHVLLNHGSRVHNASITQQHNIAMDLVINHMLIDMYGFDRDKMPRFNKELCFIDTVFENPDTIKRNESFEYYYNKLVERNIYGDGCVVLIDGDGNASYDEMCDVADTIKEYVGDKLTHEDINKLNQFAKQVAGGNTGTGIIDYSHIKAVPKKKTWSTLIRKLTSGIRATNTYVERWCPIPRRMQHLDGANIFLPNLVEGELEIRNKPRLAVFLDTSGSCKNVSERFFKAMRSIPLDDFNISYYGFTTYVYKVEGSKLKGFGGTSFDIIERELQNNILQNGDRYPDMVFVITDGYGTHVRPEKPTRWHWFLTEYSDVYYIPKDSNIHKLSDYE